MPFDPGVGGGPPLDVTQMSPVQQQMPTYCMPQQMPQQTQQFGGPVVAPTVAAPMTAAPQVAATPDPNTLYAQMVSSPAFSAVAGASGVTAGGPAVAGAVGGGPADLGAIVTQLQGITQQLATLATQLQASGTMGGGPGQQPVQQQPAPVDPKGVQGGGGGCSCCAGSNPTQGAPGGPADVPPPPGDPQPATNSGPPSGDLGSKIVQLAAAEVGTKEEGGENAGAKITEYRTSVRGPGEDPNANESWCADFVSYIFDKAGAPLKDGQGEDYVPALTQWAKEKGRFHEPNGYDPKPGDALVFDWEGDGTLDHVGIVEKVENGRVYTIEGNSADSVARRDYPLSGGPVRGYISPA